MIYLDQSTMAQLVRAKLYYSKNTEPETYLNLIFFQIKIYYLQIIRKIRIHLMLHMYK